MAAYVHSTFPEKKSDAWREDLKTLADRSGLKFKSEEQKGQQDQQNQEATWWASYYLTNPDGSKGHYLGSQCGTSKDIAKEHAAKQSYGNLTNLIIAWTQNAAASAAASTSAAISAHTNPGTFWVQELKKISKEKGLRFVCDQLQDSQGTWWATYHLINPDGSRYFQLGSRGAAASNIAVEHAAHDAVETLNRWIATWPQPGTVASSSGAGGSGS